MRKLALTCCAILILSGCALTSTYTIDSSGRVSGTTSFGVPKSSLPNVKTLEQWSKLLEDNNAPTPTPSPTDTTSETPAPEASCGAGEDLVNGQWTYGCSVSGNISALSDATNFSDITGQGGSSGLQFSRVGTTVTVTQPAGSTSGDMGSGLDLGLKGISLFYTNSTITFPGVVGTVTGGAVKVDDHTVSFPSDESQTTAMSATVDIPGISGTPTSMTLRATAGPSAVGDVDLNFAAQLTKTLAGKIEFFDGDKKIGTEKLDDYGLAKFSFTSTGNNGHHDYSATFLPADWWQFDQTDAQASIDLNIFTLSKAVTISGVARVGGKLTVGKVASVPTATKLTYEWFRNGKPINQFGVVHKVTSADINKTLTVRVKLHKAGVIDRSVVSQPVKVAKK
jgi:hypothetical protein